MTNSDHPSEGQPPGGSPLVITKRSEQELRDWVKTEVGFITTVAQYDNKPIELEPYQVEFLRDQSRFRWVTKSRQVGFSFVMALEALARCQLRSGHTSVFVSFNLDEAKDRVLLARQVFEELPTGLRKKLVVDSKTELVFESNSPRKTVSRIISVPSKAPRGKHGDTYLDELAHYLNDREVFRGSTALVLRGESQLTGCSTPLGRRGTFWEVATEQLRKYPNYSRQVVPWWLCSSFCSNPKLAAEQAGLLTTEQMVEQHGLPSIVEQFESLGQEDFEQEFCGVFVDETYSFFAYDMILSNTSDDVVLAADFCDIPVPDGKLVAGFDVGRTRDHSELAVFEQQGERFICRMLRSFVDEAFAEQEAELRHMIQVLPIERLSIDNSGIGMNMAENLSRDFTKVQRENFTNENKERWATDFKILLQRRQVMLPKDRSLVGQIHSIKKRILPSSKVSFEGERTARGGHADRFWAVALACQPERAAPKQSTSTVTCKVIMATEDRLREERREAAEKEGRHPWDPGPVSEEPVWVPENQVKTYGF